MVCVCLCESEAHIVSKKVALYIDDQADIIHFRNRETLRIDLYK